MGIFKAIKLHRETRIKQEIACFKVCHFSQQWFLNNHTPNVLENPYLIELKQMNGAVDRLNKIIPRWYHFMLDIFGYGIRMQKEIKRRIKEESDKIQSR